jgi:hypothetical protein
MKRERSLISELIFPAAEIKGRIRSILIAVEDPNIDCEEIMRLVKRSKQKRLSR